MCAVPSKAQEPIANAASTGGSDNTTIRGPAPEYGCNRQGGLPDAVSHHSPQEMRLCSKKSTFLRACLSKAYLTRSGSDPVPFVWSRFCRCSSFSSVLPPGGSCELTGVPIPNLPMASLVWCASVTRYKALGFAVPSS